MFEIGKVSPRLLEMATVSLNKDEARLLIRTASDQTSTVDNIYIDFCTYMFACVWML